MASASRPRPSRSTPQSTPPTTGVEWIVILAILVLAALRALPLLLDVTQLRLWGIDALAWLPLSVDRLIVAALPVLALLPWLQSRTDRWLAAGAFPRMHVLVIALVASAALVALGLAYPVAYAFLGDGSVYVGEMFRTARDAAHAPSFVKPTAWATGALLAALAALPATLDDVRVPFTVVSSAAAVLTTASVFFFLRDERRGTVVVLAALVAGMGGTLFFFGYIELYALPAALTLASLLAMWRALRQGASVLVPGILLAAAMAFGLAAATLLPAYLALLHWKVRGEEGGPMPLRIAVAVLAGLVVVAVAAAYLVIGSQANQSWLMPLAADYRTLDGVPVGVLQYTLFSSAHFADLANALLLGAGAAALVVPAALAAGRGVLRARDPFLLVTGLAAFGGLVQLIAGFSLFGLARDWDLAVQPLLAHAVFAAALLVRMEEGGCLRTGRIAPVLVLVALAGAWQWVDVNHTAEASARRFDAIVARDAALILPRDTYVALEHLRKFRQSGGDAAGSLDVLQRMEDTGWNLADTWRKMLQRTGAISDARARDAAYRDLLTRLLARVRSAPAGEGAGSDAAAPDGAAALVVPPSRRALADLVAVVLLQCIEQRHADIVTEYLPAFAAVLPDWRALAYLRAEAGSVPSNQRADAAFAAVDAQTREPGLLLATALQLAEAGRAESAVTRLTRVLALDGASYPQAYIALARLQYEALALHDAAIETLQRCVREVPGTPHAAEARRILERLGR